VSARSGVRLCRSTRRTRSSSSSSRVASWSARPTSSRPKLQPKGARQDRSSPSSALGGGADEVDGVVDRESMDVDGQVVQRRGLQRDLLVRQQDARCDSVIHTVVPAPGLSIIHKNLSIEAQQREVAKVKRSEHGVIGDPVTLSPSEPGATNWGMRNSLILEDCVCSSGSACV